jgi:DNA-binding NarL/FixJ family response regulator
MRPHSRHDTLVRVVDVLVVDDQPFFRGAARDVVGALPGFCIVAEASSGRQAVAVADDLRPDLVVLDVRMPGMDGIQTARELKAHHPEIVVILVSVDDHERLSAAGLSSGAAAFLRKRDFRPATLRGLWALHGAD